MDVRPRDRLHELATPLGRADRDVHDAGPVEAEHHAALQGRRRVVEVHERPRRAADRLEGPLDLLGPGLGEDLNHHVVGDQVTLDEQPHEVEVGLRGRGKADLDLLEPAAHQQIEHLALALDVHGVDQSLVAVAQVDAAPARSPGRHATGPRAIREGDRREGAIEMERHRCGRTGLRRHSSLLAQNRASAGGAPAPRRPAARTAHDKQKSLPDSRERLFGARPRGRAPSSGTGSRAGSPRSSSSGSQGSGCSCAEVLSGLSSSLSTGVNGAPEASLGPPRGRSPGAGYADGAAGARTVCRWTSRRRRSRNRRSASFVASERARA